MAELRVYDVEAIDTHGGSIRVYGCHQDSDIKEKPSVKKMLHKESVCNMKKIDPYALIQKSAENIKIRFFNFCLMLQRMARKFCRVWSSSKRKYSYEFCWN